MTKKIKNVVSTEPHFATPLAKGQAKFTQEDEKFLQQTLKLASGSFCLRKRVAAIIVKNGKIISKGVNDPLPAFNCSIIGCIRNEMKVPHGHRREICYGICAEMYAIALLAASKKNASGATLYVSIHPCRVCEGIITQSGIKRVVYAEKYPSVLPHINTLEDHHIEVIHLDIKLSKEQIEQKLCINKEAQEKTPKKLGEIRDPHCNG
ncbi:hypothetical protein HYV56_02445 [Candidatus Peregrinibacteria bacterium]|nr:hypothetical protein [Candidatus Peregrinibacteria bacterium]